MFLSGTSYYNGVKGMVQAKSYTRLTLALDIVRKITDGPLAGFHELGIIKHRIALADTITLEPADRCEIHCSHPDVPDDESNICARAIRLVQKEFGIHGAVRCSIEKRIPVMGGLAGGSANAATTLMLLDSLFSCGMNRNDFSRLGRKLGMDVPFYFSTPTAFDRESVGECEPIETGFFAWFVLLVPTFGVSTKEAYGGIDYSRTGTMTEKTAACRRALLSNDWNGVAHAVHNDFEHSVFGRFPRLAQFKELLLESGARAAFMSGSGSTIVGMTHTREDGERVVASVKNRSIQDIASIILCSTMQDESPVIQ